jgi:hypothetical protein
MFNNRTRKSNRSNSTTVRVANRPRRFTDQAGKQAMKLLNQSVSHVRGPVDPAPINNTIVVTKKVEIGLAASAVNLTGVTLSQALQGSSTFFDVLRIQKISAYGTDSGSITVDFPGQDQAHFVDRGTPGAQRAQLHLMPTFSQRSTWIPITDTTNQVTLTSTVAGGVVQVTLEARSITSGDS